MVSPEPALRPDPSPFDLPGSGSAVALCLHGLTGTPYEVRPLGDALARAGIRALGPALPGHNESPRELAGIGHEEWLGAARGHVEELRKAHSKVFGVGLSMGGLVLLALAAEGQLDAVVAVGTPLRLRQPLATLIPLLKHVVPFPRKRGGSDIRDAAARARHPSYEVMPLAAVHQLQKLQERVQAGLGRIRAPLLVAHGARDRTADPADSREIHDRVASAERRHLVFASSGHIVPVDRDGAELAEAVVAFLTPRV